MSVGLAVTIPGNPGDAAVNGWKMPVRIYDKSRRLVGVDIVECDKYRAWKDRAALIMRAAARGGQFAPGAVEVDVIAYWPRMTRQGHATGLPFGDVDAVGKASLDALEQSGVLENDGQAVDLRERKRYDKANPRIEITVRPAVE